MAKTYTSVPTVSTLATYPSATYNTYTAQNINNLIVPPMVKATRSSSSAYTNGAAFTFPTEEYDTDAMHDTSTNTSRITINTAGVYVITAAMFVEFTGSVTFTNPALTKNGSTIFSDYEVGTSPVNIRISVAHTESCAVGDYLEFACGFSGASSYFQSSNSFSSYFAATWIGRTS